MRQTLDELGIKYHIVSGSIEERLEKILKIYKFEKIISIEKAVEDAKRQVELLGVQIEADAIDAKQRKSKAPWYTRLKENVLS